MKQTKSILIFLLLFNFMFSDENKKLNIISFNIHGFKTNKIASKVNKIINKIQDFDIFFIQENWVYDNLFLKKIFNHNLFFGNKKNKTIYDSGLTIGYTKAFKLIKQEEILFDQCNGIIFQGADCLASKGFILLRLNYNGQVLDVYNTHLDSGNSLKDKETRIYQLGVLENYIYNNSLNHSMIISGDFNINYVDEYLVIDNFAKNLLLKFEFNKSNHVVDYIFYSSNNNFSLSENSYSNYDTLKYLSDHTPVFLNLNIK